jgi:hypothetical protein
MTMVCPAPIWRLRRMLPAWAAATFLAAGCSTINDGPHAFKNGWLEGEVIEVAAATAISSSRFFDCRKQSTPDQLAKDKFALVAFKHMRRLQRTVIALSSGGDVKPGELVYIKFDDCSAPIVARSSGPRIIR